MTRIGFGTAISLIKRATGQRNDPFMAYNFHLEIDGLIIGAFQEISGLSMTTNVIRKREGGRNDAERVFVNGTTFPDLVFKRGVADVDQLLGWYHEVANGRIQRKNGTIYLLDDNSLPRAYWDFEEAFPVKWDGPTFSAQSGAIAMESFTLVHEKLVRGGQAAAGAEVRGAGTFGFF